MGQTTKVEVKFCCSTPAIRTESSRLICIREALAALCILPQPRAGKLNKAFLFRDLCFILNFSKHPAQSSWNMLSPARLPLFLESVKMDVR